jgi:ABC-type nickel/cobalt efflux system permease component RcnA
MERSKFMKAGGIHYRNTLMALLLAAAAGAHPLGNLSVNHLVRLEPGARGVAVDYMLDLGEMPVFELMQRWGVDRAGLRAAAPAHAGEWISGLSFRENGAALQPELKASEFEAADSPGDLATMRATLHLFVPAKGGRFEFADRNHDARSGWREILIVPAPGAEIARASNGGADTSSQLRDIPEDRPPLNQRAAWMEWRPAPGLAAQTVPPVIVPSLPVPIGGPPTRELPRARPSATAANPAGNSRTGAISDILRRKNISVPVFITLLALAFWFGALHALEPGHGKTMVAAYLVGARGTPKHAALLGASVTFTHTASVFLLGLATLFVSRFVMPDRISRVLGVASGISILWIGAMLLWRRMRTLRASAPDHGHAHDHHHPHDHPHPHDHDHHHAHDHAHDHAHVHDHDHAGQHSHGAPTHTHDGHTHTHAPEGDISVRSLIALGASGGLVPCPSALILLLTAISLGRTGLGLVLLCAFSAGLAIVLTATGMAVLYAKRLIPERRRSNPAVVRYVPVFSAAVIVIIGAVMTGVSLGWIPAGRFIG